MDQRYRRQRVINPTELGLSAVTLATERTSNSIGLNGASRLAVYVKHSANSAATRIDVNLDVTPEGMSGETVSNWYVSQTAAIAAGTVTLSDEDIQKAVSGVKLFEVRFDELNAAYCRIRISGTSGAAGDIVSVTAIVAD